MTINPGIIALLLSSILTASMLAYAALFATSLLRRWDLRSGSRQQLSMERRTYLISMLLAYVLGFEVLALFLFIQTAEGLHTLFVGAMCAAGTLYVNPYGYPALLARMALATLAGLWLVLNRLDGKAPDYPIIRLRYWMIILMAPLAMASAVLNWQYLTGLRADVITSCCGTLFSQGGGSILRTDILIARPDIVRAAYVLGTALTFIIGSAYYFTGRWARLFAAISGLMLPLALLALTSWISPYIYELPTHHCPFCMIQADYAYIGYFLYAALLMGSVLGMGAGLCGALRGLRSMEDGAEGPRRQLTLASLAAFGLFTAIVIWSISLSNLRIN